MPERLCDFEGQGPCWGKICAVDHYGPTMFDTPVIACEGHAEVTSAGIYTNEDGSTRPWVEVAGADE